MNELVVGVDCATEDAKLGLSLAERGSALTAIKEATVCARDRSALSTVTGWLRNVRGPVLLAIDAPFGWPIALSQVLSSHCAGAAIDTTPNLMFRRSTDRFIQAHVGKTPLDVGADRIARTAHAALKLLGDLRTALRLDIPLAWSSDLAGVATIEVYPAATLVAHGIRSKGYKKPSQTVERQEMVRALDRWLDVGTSRSLFESNADALDSAVCVLAAVDFLEGRAMGPCDQATALREGWIWSQKPRT